MGPLAAATRRLRGRLAGRGGFLLAVLGVGLMCATWAVATPLFAYPDEPAHVTRAVAVVDGQVIAPDEPVTSAGWPIIRAPNSLAKSVYRTRCLWSGYGHPNVPANCVRALPTSRRMVSVPNAAGRYEPLYYAAIGWPLRSAPTAQGVYAARLVNAGLCTLLLAVALAAFGVGGRGGEWRRLAVLTGLTPFVLYISGGINPSSWEICAAVATWATLLRLCSWERSPRWLLPAAAAAAATLAVTRPLGPLWLALIAAVAAGVAPRARLRALLRQKQVWIALTVVAGACLASVGWTLTQVRTSVDAATAAHPVSFLSALGRTFDLLPYRSEQLVAVFGWLDVPVPWLTLAVWGALLALLVLAALRPGASRARWALLALLAATVVVPALLEADLARRVGMIWQGRYTLPLAAGIPILAGELLHRSEPHSARLRWLLPLACAGAGVAQVLAFVWALRRYEHGVPGSLNPFTGAWLPPGGPVLAIAAFGLGAAALSLAVGAGRARAAVAIPLPTADSRLVDLQVHDAAG